MKFILESSGTPLVPRWERDPVTLHYALPTAITAFGNPWQAEHAQDFYISQQGTKCWLLDGNRVHHRGFQSGWHSTPQAGGPFVAMASAEECLGYWLMNKFGHLVRVGNVPLLPPPQMRNTQAVSITAAPQGHGAWVLGQDGQVHHVGTALHLGHGIESGKRAIKIRSLYRGLGYFILYADGTVRAFGEAKHFGEAILEEEIALDLLVTPDGGGYWLAVHGKPWLAFGNASAMPVS
ncbi:MAG: hypothetical protein AAFQ98_23715 [Bacteroidota bacterium]